MSKVKKSWITILSFFAALLLAFGVAFALPHASASAAEMLYLPSDAGFMFRPGDGGEVGTNMPESPEEDGEYFVQLSMRDGGTVEYRRKLALKWYEKTEDDASGRANPGVAVYFSMTFGLPEVNFEKLSVIFSGDEENISKEEKSVNTLIFTKSNTADKVNVQLKNADLGEDDALPEAKEISQSEITLSIDEIDCSVGEFRMSVNDIVIGKLTNIGGYYLNYLSTANTSPNVPVTFKTELPSGSASDATQKVVIKELNKQSFQVNSDGKVADNAPAVLVINQQVYAFRLGQKFSLTYEVMDVCDDSVSLSRYYYVLKTDEAGNYVKPDEATGSSDYKSLTTSTFFLPTGESDTEEEYISIRFRLDDGADGTFVYLTWYAAEGAVKTLGNDEAAAIDENEEEGEEEEEPQSNYFDYMIVNRDKGGPVYNGLTADDGAKENVIEGDALQKAADAYQEDLTAAAAKATAGTGAYVYLPSLRGLISSRYADYRNLKFSVYYYNESHATGADSSSKTSLSYNGLKLEVTEEGWYRLRIIASDSNSNSMQYYYDGELVTVSSENIWEIEEIPEFTFYVKYDGASIEKQKADDTKIGYRNSTYTFTSFTVIALSGYEKDYTLYRIDQSKITGENTLPSLSTLISEMPDKFDMYLNEWQCLDEIQKYRSDIEEGDKLWDDTDNDYHWNPDSSLSFIPQEKAYYVLKITVNDASRPGHEATGYQVIEVTNNIDTIPGVSNWLKNNVVSVVLFSVSGVLAIAVVVLFLVKPSDKNVDEIDLDKLKGKKK